MNKHLLVELLLLTQVYANTHTCIWYSIDDIEKNDTVVINKNYKVTFKQKDNTIVMHSDDDTMVFYRTDLYLKDAKVYSTKDGNLLAVYQDYLGGIRVVSPKYVLDFINCIRTTK